jgi:hypothetical protein
LIARMFGPCTVRIMKIENFVWACSRIGRVLPSGLAGRRGMAGGAAGGRGPRRGRSSSRTLVVGTSRHKVFIILTIIYSNPFIPVLVVHRAESIYVQNLGRYAGF